MLTKLSDMIGKVILMLETDWFRLRFTSVANLSQALKRSTIPNSAELNLVVILISLILLFNFRQKNGKIK